MVFRWKYVFLLITKLGNWTFSKTNVLFPVKNNSSEHFSTAMKRIIQTAQFVWEKSFLVWFLCLPFLGMRNQKARPRTNTIVFVMISLTLVPEQSLGTEQVCPKETFLTFGIVKWFWENQYHSKKKIKIKLVKFYVIEHFHLLITSVRATVKTSKCFIIAVKQWLY